MNDQAKKEELYLQILEEQKSYFQLMAQKRASPGDFQDLHQEICMEAWKGLDGFEERSSPATWARRVASNIAGKSRRNGARREKALRAYGEQLPRVQQGGRDEAGMLREFMELLSEADRILFGMFLEGKSEEEISEALGIDIRNVRVKIHRIKAQFKEHFF